MENLETAGTSRYYDKLVAVQDIARKNMHLSKRGGRGIFDGLMGGNPLLGLLTAMLDDDSDKPSNKPSSQDGDNPQIPPEEGQGDGQE